MNPTNLAALVTAITGLVTAIGAVIGLIRHATGPAHQDPPTPEQPQK